MAGTGSDLLSADIPDALPSPALAQLVSSLHLQTDYLLGVHV